MDLLELKEEATDTDLYMLAGRIKEQSGEGKRTTEPKTEGSMTKLQKTKKRLKREDREYYRQCHSPDKWRELLVTDDFTAACRSETAHTTVHTQTFTAPLVCLNKCVGTSNHVTK